jgi:hypothetical protein
MVSLNQEHWTFSYFGCHLFLSYSNIIFRVVEYWVADSAFSTVIQELQFQYFQIWKLLSLPIRNKIDILLYVVPSYALYSHSGCFWLNVYYIVHLRNGNNPTKKEDMTL